MMLYIGRRAREAAHDACACLDRSEERSARADGGATRAVIREDHRSQPPGSRGRAEQGSRRRLPRPAQAGRTAGGGDGARLARGGGACRSGRPGDGALDAAERPGDFPRARAAGRDRHHLRVAAECDGRRGGALPEVGQRRDPAQRLRELSHLARHRQCVERGHGRLGSAGGLDPARADGRSLGGRASCSAALPAPST